MAVQRRLRDDSDDNHDQPAARRMRPLPSFGWVVREALLAETIHRICSAVEPVVRRAVHDELKVLFNHTPTLHRAPQLHIEEIEPSPCQMLVFTKRRVSLSIFTDDKIIGRDGRHLQICLIDTKTGAVITDYQNQPPIKVELVVLDGDFTSEGNLNWTSDEFSAKILTEREGRRPLLVGDLTVTLNQGMATVGDVALTDNSSWIRSRKFRLGARVWADSYQGPRIMEALTESFMVKDRRGALYKKHYPPCLSDKVWRLENIGKGGAFRRRLEARGIDTVSDFLTLLNANPLELKKVLNMPDRAWESTVKHARTCTIEAEYEQAPPSNADIELRTEGEIVGNLENMGSILNRMESNSYSWMLDPVEGDVLQFLGSDHYI